MQEKPSAACLELVLSSFARKQATGSTERLLSTSTGSGLFRHSAGCRCILESPRRLSQLSLARHKDNGFNGSVRTCDALCATCPRYCATLSKRYRGSG